MATAIVRHKILEDERFLQVFEGNLKMLFESGCTRARLLRSAEDPHDVTVIVEWPEITQMQDFLKSQAGNDSAQRAGVIGQPEGRMLAAWKDYHHESVREDRLP